MVQQLASEESEGGPWRAEPLMAVVNALIQLGRRRAGGGRGVVLAVDGRSSGGKSTLAARLQDAIATSAVVHTDDIAWWHSRFGWADLLIDGVLVPFHRGEMVSFRPPRWAGVGAGRPAGSRTPEPGACRAAWRGVDGQGPSGVDGQEDPFLAGERSWSRADLLAAGTPQVPVDRATELVVAPPLGRPSFRQPATWQVVGSADDLPAGHESLSGKRQAEP